MDFPKLSASYEEALLGSLIPFYLKNSPDMLCGGYFDFLSDTGESIDADKLVSQQARQVWAFAKIYNTLRGSDAWLQHARQGANFLSHFAHSPTLACYAMVDRRGRLVAPATDACTDAAVVMAYCQMHQATGEDEWAMLAKQLLANLLRQRNAQRTEQARTIDGYRVLWHLSEPVAVLQALLEAQPLLSEEDWKDSTQAVLDELLNEFLDKRQDILREWIQPEGAFLNTPEGRRISAGHTFRAASVAHDLATETGNRKLALQASAWTLQICEWTWDQTTLGLDSWVDLKNGPLPYPDWKQRWAWVHLEGLVALMKAWLYTRHPDALKWLQRLHDYTFQHFPDSENGGWHLALNRQSKPLFQAKATLSTGSADLIAPLFEASQLADQCAKLKPGGTIRRVGLGR